MSLPTLLPSLVCPTERTEPRVGAEKWVRRVYHEEEVRMTGGAVPTRGCRCNPEHIRQVSESFPESDRADRRGEDGMVSVDCKFCARVWLSEA